jgi:hypothetical protein
LGGGVLATEKLRVALLTVYPDHARLKEHVANMDGGLEAKINEGGK